MDEVNQTFRTYTKIKRLGDEENKDIFSNPDDDIIIQEKVDGANFRFMIKDGNIIFGSRTQLLQENKEHKFQKNFNRGIQFVKDNLKGIDLSLFNNLIFYGECMVAHSMQYDWDKVPPFLGFDIYDLELDKWADFGPVCQVYEMLRLPMVPLVKICKASEIDKVDDNIVPISKYAIPSGTDDTRKAEGVVFKNYERQIFAKYVRDKFKEINAEVFGSKQVKYNGEDNTPDLVFKYCTNARIDKIIFKKEDFTLPEEFSNDGYKSDCECCSECDSDCEDRIRNREEIEIKRNEFRSKCIFEYNKKQEELSQTEINQHELKASCAKSFTLDNGKNFFKLNNAISMKQKNLEENEYIEKNYNLVVCQNTSNIKLRNYVNYLDEELKAGWTCTISNISNNDLNISTDGLKSLSNRYLNLNDILIEKYTTKKLTLVYSNIDDEFLWVLY
jgi:hypothetical protein